METKELSNKIKKFRDDRDWEKFHTPANLSKSISIEANELLECFQWDENNYDLEHVKEELGDVLIYSIHLCNTLGLDPIEVASEKLDKASKKYPVDKCKGKSTKYNKL